MVCAPDFQFEKLEKNRRYQCSNPASGNKVSKIQNLIISWPRKKNEYSKVTNKIYHEKIGDKK